MNIKIHYLAFYVIVLSLFSCSKEKNLSTLLNINKNVNFNHSKTIRDVKNNFEVNIGDKWKRELYFDDYQSRIYTADTTRSYSSSFIIDITRFKGKIIIEDAFRDKLMSEIQKKHNTYLIKEGFIELKNKPGYCIFSFEKQPDIEIYKLECYLTSGDYYYLLTSTINGSDNLNNSVNESLAIFNSLKILP